jgi:DNA repair exonuclease SbcCD ATPase subunit
MTKLDFKQIGISGFKSFQDEETLDLPKRPGFFLLTGDNKVESDLGANGAGKSTIWDALCWCMYGKTTRGVRGPSLKNWQGSSCVVGVHFNRCGTDHVLIRSMGPNTLTLDSEVVTQDHLDKLFGLSYVEFLNTVLMGQFNSFFFDLSPTEKLTVFNQVLNLESWQDASDRAKRRERELASEIQTLEVRLSGRKSTEEAAIEHIKSLREIQSQFREQQEELISKTEDEVSDLCSKRKELDKQIKPYAKKIRDVLDSNEVTKLKYITLTDKCDEEKEKLSGLQSDKRVIDGKLTELRKSATELNTLKGGKCHVCRQKISGEHVKKEVVRLETEIKSYDEETGLLLVEIVIQQEVIDGVKENMKKIGALIDSTQEEYNQLRSKESSLKSQLTSLRDRSAYLDKKLVDLNDQLRNDNFTSQIEESEKQLKKCRDSIELTTAELKSFTKERLAVEFWIKGFKELRLWLVEEALKEFEIAVNNSLYQLGLSDWTVLFDVERETKSGGVSKGFTVGIVPPGLEEAIPWESWSGGETQRLRIAGAIGLASLISARKGIDCNIEVWDEPTAHLSEEGIVDLLSFFSERSRDVEKQIWMVDHRSLSSGDFDGRVMVLKDESGSHVLAD